MTKKNKNLLQYFLFLVLGIVMLYFSLRDIDFDILWDQLLQTRPFYVFMIVVTGVISFVVRAARWKLLIEATDEKSSLVNLSMAVCIGYLVNIVTPRLGEIARCGIIHRYDKISLEKLAGTVVVDRVMDMILLLLMTLLMIVFNTDDFLKMFGTEIENMNPAQILKSIALVILAVLVVIQVWKWLARYLRKKNPTLLEKINRSLGNIREGLLSVRKIKNMWAFVTYTLLLWGCYLLMVYWGFLAYPGMAELGLAEALTVLVFGSFGMIITPGGIGAYQLIVQNVLHTLYNIPVNNAGGFSLLSWTLQTLIMVVTGVFSMIMLPVVNRIKDA